MCTFPHIPQNHVWLVIMCHSEFHVYSNVQRPLFDMYLFPCIKVITLKDSLQGEVVNIAKKDEIQDRYWEELEGAEEEGDK